MADTVYKVLTVYDVDTKSAKSEVGSLAVVADHALSLLRQGKEMIGSVIELHSAAENATIAIAGLMSAGDYPGAKNFQTAMGMSAEIIKQMRKDARDLPGEFEDLQNIFQFSLLGGAQAGQSVSGVEGMAAKLMAVTKSLGISSEFAGREFAELMEGRASSRVTLFAKLKNMMGEGMDASKFNALSAPEKWQAIQKALGSFGPMIDEYGKSWDAISSTATDYLKTLARIGSAGLFATLKDALQSITVWFENNQTQIESFVQEVGTNLGHALIDGLSAMKTVFGWIVEHRDTLIQVAEAFAAIKVFNGARSIVSGALEFAAPAAGAIASGTAGSSVAAMGASALAFATSPATIGVIAAAVVAYGGYKIYEASKNSAEAAAKIDPTGSTTDAVERHAQVWDAVRGSEEQRQSLMYQAGLIDALGFNEQKAATFAERFGNSTEQIHEIVDRLREATSKLPEQAQAMAELFEMASSSLKQPMAELADHAKEMVYNMTGGLVRFGAAPPEKTDVQKLLAQEKKAAPHRPDMNVQVRIEQTINDAENPRRVLDMTKRALRESLEQPTRTFAAGVYR